MGLFERLFNISSKSIDEEVRQPILVKKEINDILLIFRNLGLLDVKEIKNVVTSKNKDIDASILNRLMLEVDNDSIVLLKKYYDFNDLGYGSIKIEQIEEKLNDLSLEKEKDGKNKLEIIEELIEYSKEEINNYERIMKSLNDTIRTLEQNTSDKTELLVMVDYWVNYYREERLGYPLDLDRKVDEMVRELKTLPYGGFGIDEINNFEAEANKMIADARLNNEPTNLTLNRIINTLFNPRKNRFNADLEALNRKIKLINESSSISDAQKKKNVAMTISEFNKLNGHRVTNPTKTDSSKRHDTARFLIEVNIEKLVNLDGGGYGAEAICEYRDICKKIINSNSSYDDTNIQINEYAKMLIDTHNNNLKLFKNWKDRQLSLGKYTEEELDSQMRYMLSLSPNQLHEYLLNDSLEKKKFVEKHNYEVAFRYLAKKESEKKEDIKLYVERMAEYEAGLHPYSKNEIEKAYTDLMIDSFSSTGNEYIDVIEFIDGTLIHQIYADAKA